MSKSASSKLLEHPDRDEIISKLIIGVSSSDIHEWLKSKYTNVSENRFVLSEKSIKLFQDNYLDIYNFVQQDLSKTRTAIAKNMEGELELAVANSPAYKDIMIRTANEELDIRKTIKNLCVAIETRLSQVFDEIRQDPRNINTRIDRLLIDYAEILGNLLEKYYKFTEEPAETVVQHNVTLQVVDQHVAIFRDSIKNILAEIDLESSFRFLEMFNERMLKLKEPEKDSVVPSGLRLAEAKLLNETINEKINK